jgi:hypothetical protein
MPDSEQVARIRAYLEQHRQTYEREALRQKLLADGHDPQAVDLAMAQVFGLQIAPAPSSGGFRLGRPGYILLIVCTALLNILILPAAVVLMLRLGGNLSGTSLLVGSLAPLMVVLLLETLAILFLRGRSPQVARGLVLGLGTSLALVVPMVLLLGGCVALISSVAG